MPKIPKRKYTPPPTRQRGSSDGSKVDRRPVVEPPKPDVETATVEHYDPAYREWLINSINFRTDPDLAALGTYTATPYKWQEYARRYVPGLSNDLYGTGVWKPEIVLKDPESFPTIRHELGHAADDRYKVTI